MKKIASIITLICFLSSTTEAHELFKLQHLLDHYFEHCVKGERPSLTDFLHVHYSHDHENHQDEHHDKGCLPFQGDHSCQINIALFSNDNYIELTVKPQVSAIEQQTLLSNFFPQDYLSKIWQPPRLS